MKKIWEQYQHIIIIAVLTIAVIAVIWYWAYHSGKKYVPKDVVLPVDSNTGDQTFNPGKYTDIVYNQVYGFIMFAHNNELLQSVANLSDSQLVAVYNDWSKRYFEKDKETMTQALEGEVWPGDPSWSAIKDGIVSRLKKYNAS
jgi:hypothetical protein